MSRRLVTLSSRLAVLCDQSWTARAMQSFLDLVGKSTPASTSFGSRASRSVLATLHQPFSVAICSAASLSEACSRMPSPSLLPRVSAS
eukprot:7912535-Pyramimonas_sp.AAC.1